MAEDIEFVNGLIVKAPRENAPDFVKASISIKVNDLREWLDKQSGEWVNIDVKESKGGRWYAAVNAYKPKESKPEPERKPATPSGSFEDFESDIPF